MTRRTAFFLVGIPYSGKSTWATNRVLHRDMKAHGEGREVFIVSTDKYIQAEAHQKQKPYHKVFSKYAKKASDRMIEDIRGLSEEFPTADIIIDQTNITRESRERKLTLFDKTWNKVAVEFDIPTLVEFAMRFQLRPSKKIPFKVIADMLARYEEPDVNEGFNLVTCPDLLTFPHLRKNAADERTMEEENLDEATDAEINS